MAIFHVRKLSNNQRNIWRIRHQWIYRLSLSFNELFKGLNLRYPTADKARLSLPFEVLFGQKTRYEDLDKRLSLTLAKNEVLLAVLAHPEIPLHNKHSGNGVQLEEYKANSAPEDA